MVTSGFSVMGEFGIDALDFELQPCTYVRWWCITIRSRLVHKIFILKPVKDWNQLLTSFGRSLIWKPPPHYGMFRAVSVYAVLVMHHIWSLDSGRDFVSVCLM